MKNLQIAIAILLVFCAFSTKIFYIGGATSENETLVYTELAKTIP